MPSANIEPRGASKTVNLSISYDDLFINKNLLDVEFLKAMEAYDTANIQIIYLKGSKRRFL